MGKAKRVRYGGKESHYGGSVFSKHDLSGSSAFPQQVKSTRRVSVAEEPERRGTDSQEVLQQFRVT